MTLDPNTISIYLDHVITMTGAPDITSTTGTATCSCGWIGTELPLGDAFREHVEHVNQIMREIERERTETTEPTPDA